MDYMDYRPSNSLLGKEEKQMGLILHISQLAGLIIPLAGIIIPIILWQTQKDKMPSLDAHGKMVVNWFISFVIYGAVSFVLTFVLIGVLGLIALGVMSIVFPIVGGLKASNGELWEYPLTIKFLK